MSAAISAIATSMPERFTAVEDLPEIPGLTEIEAQNLRGVGIDTVGDDPELDAAALAARAAAAALGDAGLSPAEVSALILVQARVPEYFMASEATKVQAALGVSEAMTFTVADLGCVSISAALLTAKSLLAGDDRIDNVLIAHGSKAPTPRRYRHPVTVNGEGGIALAMGRDGDLELVDISLETDGTYWELFRVRYRDIPHSQWYEECTSTKDYSFRLAIESRNRFTRMNDELLARNGLSAGDVDHYVMQNLSAGAFQFYEDHFKIAFAKACRTNLQRYGHLGSMDVVLNLHTAISSGEFGAGDLVLVMNNSPVAAWSSMLVRVQG